MRNKLKIKLLGLLVVGLMTFGCSKTTSNVGLEVRPDQDIVVVCADIFLLDCENYEAPAISAQADTMVLGEFHSTTFGDTKAELLLQFAAPEDYAFPDESYEPKPDSLVLLMYYNSYFGSAYAPLEFSVYEINKNSIDYSTRYYSDLNPGDYCDSTILMGKRVMTSVDLSPKDSSYIADDEENFKYVRYKFDDSQCQRFFNILQKHPKITTEEFLNDFKGLYITTRYGSSTLLYMNQITMFMYYHYTYKRNGKDTTVSSSITFPANHEVRQLNRFVHKDRNQVVSSIPDSLLYIKSVAGIYPKLTVPIGSIYHRMMQRMDTSKYLAIAAAELRLENIELDETDVWMDPPTYLMAIEESQFDDFIRHNQVPDGYETDRSLGLYSVNTNSYLFDLSFLLARRLREETILPDDKMTFIVLPVDVASSTSSSGATTINKIRPLVKLSAAKVRSSKNSNSPLRLKILYQGF